MAWAAAFGLLALLPGWLGGTVAHLEWDAHRLLWENLAGADYRIPPAAADPLSVLRAGLPGGSDAFYLSAAAGLALAPVGLAWLSRELRGERATGALAAGLLLAGNGWLLAGPGLTGDAAVVWVGLAAVAAAAFAAGRLPLAFAAAGLSGLVRPEGWGLAALMAALLWWTEREEFRARYAAVPVLAAAGWAAAGLALEGDPLYLGRLARGALSPAPAGGTGPLAYLARGLETAPGALHPALAAAGIAGLGAELTGAESGAGRRGHGLLAGLLALSVLGGWALGPVAGIDAPRAWWPTALLVLCFYAAALPRSVARRIGRPGWARGRAGWTLLAAWVAVAGLLAGRTRPLESAARTVEARTERQGARVSAAGWLRENWLGGDGALLAGRSLPHYARALGPDASRRMYTFGEVASDSSVAARLGEGVAVHVTGDAAGPGAVFRVLATGGTARYGALRFRPAARIGAGARPPGLIHRFRRSPEGDGG